MEARKTEYKGIVFRSKSEAVFARALDLGGWVWEYEPDRFRSTDGWVPDFWVVRIKMKDQSIFSCLIELKPCDPTETYKTELLNRFKEIGFCRYGFPLLVCGSPFDTEVPRKIYSCEDGKWCARGYIALFFGHWERALEYRFDLSVEADHGLV